MCFRYDSYVKYAATIVNDGGFTVARLKHADIDDYE